MTYSYFAPACAEMTTKIVLKRTFTIVTVAVLLVILTLALSYNERVQVTSVSPDQLQASIATTYSSSAVLEQTVSVPQGARNATSKSVHIYLERFDDLNLFYNNYFAKAEKYVPHSCPLTDNTTCVLHHSKEIAQTSDVVFRMVRFISPEIAERYHNTQLLAVLMTEAEGGEYGLQQLHNADIRVDHHPSSEVVWSEACGLPVKKWETEPAANATQRSGIAMFTSNCAAKWRSQYFSELMKHVDIDSYGHCLHNVDIPASHHSRRGSSFIEIGSKYRMVITFENTIEDDYITEKIGQAYKSGAIPVYWGPPQIYSWVPGNHTFIDASTFEGPEDLAKYLKRVNEEDELFQYHTSNFDIAKTKERIYKVCPQMSVICSVCQVADLKLRQRAQEISH